MDSVERSLATDRDACGTGFVAETAGPASRRVMELALRACECVEHRGACGADGVSGDGAGILSAIPWEFYAETTPELEKFRQEDRFDHVGLLSLFLPADEHAAAVARQVIESCCGGAGFQVIAWRSPPIDRTALGETANATMPRIEQLFVTKKVVGGEEGASSLAWTGNTLERALYLLRRSIRGAWIRAVVDPNVDTVDPDALENEDNCYVASCSSRTVVYKAMCRSSALRRFYKDLDDPRFLSTFCIYHRRFSTNTLPRWSLAQPFRLLAHNGEINCVRGNVNWMTARAKAAGDDLGIIAAGCRTGSDDDAAAAEACAFVNRLSLGPVVDAGKSDSANLDATCELYTRSGRSVVEATTVMLPPANVEGQAFFDLHAPLCEAWDGPAGLCFSDGAVVGARLDRNGLRPARYTLYDDGLVCLSSETGSVNADPNLAAMAMPWLPGNDAVVAKGRLGPGETCVVDLVDGKGFMTNDAVMAEVTGQKDKWEARLKTHVRKKAVLSQDASPYRRKITSEVKGTAYYGWGAEDVELQVKSMALTGKEPTSSMGDDAPLAVLSDMPHPLYNYFKQRHAQVTNPPIDPIREGRVMSLRTFVGERENCVDVALDIDEPRTKTKVIELPSPLVTESDLDDMITFLDGVVLSTSYSTKTTTLKGAVENIIEKALAAVRDRGANLVVLSDTRTPDDLYVPPLLAVGAVHHAFIKAGLRLKASIAVETGQCWSTHHFACLVGYGASAVHAPLLLQEAVMAADKELRKIARKEAKTKNIEFHEEAVVDDLVIQKIRGAIDSGLLKVLSKMGIAELASYHGAQIFEAIGLGPDVVKLAFRGTASRVGGLTLEDVEKEVKAFALKGGGAVVEKGNLENFGFHSALGNDKGEVHGNSPKVARLLQAAVRDDDPDVRLAKYKEFVQALKGRQASTPSSPRPPRL